MQEKVQRFIDSSRSRLAAAADAEKRQRLIRLGLTEGTKREYSNSSYRSELYPECDEKSGKYYRTVPVPLAVTDEEYAAICRYDTPPADSKADAGIRLRAVSTARTIATIWLVAGIGTSVFLLFDALAEGAYWSLANAVLLLLGVLLSRALLLIFCDMAQTLRRIERQEGK